MPRSTVTEQPTRADQRRAMSEALNSVRDRPISRAISQRQTFRERAQARRERERRIREYLTDSSEEDSEPEAKSEPSESPKRKKGILAHLLEAITPKPTLLSRTKQEYKNSCDELKEAKANLAKAKQASKRKRYSRDREREIKHLHSQVTYASVWEKRRKHEYNDAKRGIDSTDYLALVRKQELKRRGGKPLKKPPNRFRPAIPNIPGEFHHETSGRLFIQNGYDPDLPVEMDRRRWSPLWIEAADLESSDFARKRIGPLTFGEDEDEDEDDE